MGLLLLSRADLRHVTAAVRKGLLYYTGPIADTGDCTELHKFGHFIQMCLKRQSSLPQRQSLHFHNCVQYHLNLKL
jgi:hypothetical protein